MKDKLFALMLFTRFSALGGTVAIVLLGAGTVAAQPGARLLWGLVGVGVAFHVYSYVLNDVVDLPVDRSEPRRLDFPLVRGTISRGLALGIALIQIPLACLLTYWCAAGLPAYGALLASLACMTIYNLWGKKAFFPPLTDLVQGLGWGGLGLYGAYLAGGGLSAGTLVLLVYIIVMILMANGVHGSMRDLKNDYQLEVRSTAIMFGAKPALERRVTILPSLRRYAMLLNLLLVGIILGALLTNQLGYHRSTLPWLLGVEIVLSLLSLGILYAISRGEHDQGEMNSGGLIHLLVLYLMLILLILPGMGSTLAYLVVLVFFFPVLTHRWLYTGIRWALDKVKRVRRQEKRGA